MFRAKLPSIFSTCHKMPRLTQPCQCDLQKTRNATRLKCCACHEKWRWTCPKCCACHENCNTSSENVAKVLRLPRKTTFDTLQNTSEPGEPFDRKKGSRRPFGQMATKNGYGRGKNMWPWKRDLAVKRCAFGREKALNGHENTWKTWKQTSKTIWPWNGHLAVNMFFRGREQHVHTFRGRMVPQECNEVPRLPRETKQRHIGNLQKWPPLQNFP